MSPRSQRSDGGRGLASRKAALAALTAVLDDEKPLDVAWRSARLDQLDARDAGFARLLVLTTLRRLGSIDAVIDRFVRKRPGAAEMRAVHVLRLAGAELLALDRAAHAAVDGAVRLVKADRRIARLSGLVNAVARRMASEGVALFDELDAERLDTPAWLWMRLVHDYGENPAHAIAHAHRNGAPLDLTARGDPAELAERLGGRLLPSGSVRLEEATGAVDALPGFAEGHWWAQDAAAALPARMLGEVRGKSVLDLCAAPGGKTMQLASAGAQVTALDVSRKRAGTLVENLLRTRLAVDVQVADALDWEPPGPFDAILLDAPCSATGTIRRHPDLPYRKSGRELQSLVPLQDALLDRAWGWLRPGGSLVYAVCSLLPAEGVRRLAAFRERQPKARLVPVEAAALGAPVEAVVDGCLRTLPSHWEPLGGMDGFFAARLEKP